MTFRSSLIVRAGQALLGCLAQLSTRPSTLVGWLQHSTHAGWWFDPAMLDGALQGVSTKVAFKDFFNEIGEAIYCMNWHVAEQGNNGKGLEGGVDWRPTRIVHEWFLRKCMAQEAGMLRCIMCAEFWSEAQGRHLWHRLCVTLWLRARQSW